MNFQLLKTDAKSAARAGQIETTHGLIETPVFMPVGTQASVKAISPRDLDEIGAQIVLANMYHLYLRPGGAIIQNAGGIQKFSAWHRPVLTDSGGFQIFSLSKFNRIYDKGIRFRSHIDGSEHFLSPEDVVRTQRRLGSDIMMVLDECVPYPCEYEEALIAHNRTIEWAQKSLLTFSRTETDSMQNQALFAIIQGSTYKELRQQSAESLIELDFPGYAIGGLSVGEPKSLMYEMTALCTDLLPEDKPRYLMGVGKPEDILNAIEYGVDMFDCILPTRNGRNGTVFSRHGQFNIKNAQYKEDYTPLDDTCNCYTCKTFSKSYLRHLFNAKELLVLRLLSLHNLHFYLHMVRQARKAILDQRYSEWKALFLDSYHQNNQRAAFKLIADDFND